MIRNLFILAVLFSSVAFAASETKVEPVSAKATTLNNQAKKTMGVDIAHCRSFSKPVQVVFC